MPQTTITATTQPQQSTCAGCPKFHDYHDRERGLCQVFDRVVRRHHTLTQDCQRQLESEQLQELLSTYKAFLKPVINGFPGRNVYQQLPELGYERIGYISQNLVGWFALNQHGLTVADRLPSQNEAIQKLLDSFKPVESKDYPSPLEKQSTPDFQTFEPEDALPPSQFDDGSIVKVIDEGEDHTEWADFVVIGKKYNQQPFSSTQAYLSEPNWYYQLASVNRNSSERFWVSENEICHAHQSELIETADIF